ncbi:glucokinase [Fervidicella metallireducens AeB]|uniref:Glucokinase n=1 Tax=Fervidicella metallireducens AeB TaxID=1403537 RepID=A0A017RVJ0_9CLOT|nr:ROK family glucokinase [Fervidicella metallireducens]EYE88697.1 glucokinase [Fervidicella metallireducens AeB]
MLIGIDLGGTNIAAGIVDLYGEIKHLKSIPTNSERGYEAIVRDIVKLVFELCDEYGIDKSEIKSIGIGIPGIADKKGNVISCVNLNWNDVPLKIDLEEYFKIPVFVDNDATVAALAEFECGVMKGAESGVLLTLGTGIGGGIVLNGEVYSGFNGVGSEIGHMVIGENFYDCNCGKNGCFETFASSTAIIKYSKKLLEETNEASLLKDEIKGDFTKLNAKLIFDFAQKGDKLALNAVTRLIKYLGIGIGNIITIMDPEIIAIGGGISNAGEYLLNLVREEVEKNKNFKNMPIGRIELAKLRNNAGIIGAAMIGKHGIR